MLFFNICYFLYLLCFNICYILNLHLYTFLYIYVSSGEGWRPGMDSSAQAEVKGRQSGTETFRIYWKPFLRLALSVGVMFGCVDWLVVSWSLLFDIFICHCYCKIPFMSCFWENIQSKLYSRLSKLPLHLYLHVLDEKNVNTPVCM